MSDVAVKNHDWIKLEITSVHVLPGLDGEPVIFVDPDEDIMAAYSCQYCGDDLDASTMNGECAGETP